MFGMVGFLIVDYIWNWVWGDEEYVLLGICGFVEKVFWIF